MNIQINRKTNLTIGRVRPAGFSVSHNLGWSLINVSDRKAIGVAYLSIYLGRYAIELIRSVEQSLGLRS